MEYMMPRITIHFITAIVLLLGASGDDDASGNPAFCEALANEMAVCDPAPIELAAQARTDLIQRCETAIAEGE